MLLLDSPAQARFVEGGKKDASAALRQQELEREIRSNIVSVNLEDGWDCTSFEQRIGHPLTLAEVQRRLLLCNANLIFERSIQEPKMTGLYYEKTERTPAGAWTKRKVFMFTLASSDPMPEKEVVHVRKKRVPNPELINALGGKVDRDTAHWMEIDEPYDYTRGWASVLIRLLKSGLVNMGDIEKHFPEYPKNSKNWAEHMR